MNYDEWLAACDDYALEHYAIDAAEVVQDTGPIVDAYQAGEEPSEVIEFYANKWDLQELDPISKEMMKGR